jgi:hypothetical protein
MRRRWLAIPPSLLFAAGAAWGWFASDTGQKEVPGLSPAAAPMAPEVAERPGEPGSREAFLHQLEHTPAADFAALWAELKRQKPPVSPLFIDESIEELLLFARWAEVDPQAAALAALEVKKASSLLLSSVFGVWAEREPDAALAALLAMEEESHRESAARGMHTTALRSPGELTAWMQRLRPLLGEEISKEAFDRAMLPASLTSAFSSDPAAFNAMTAALPEDFRQPFLIAGWCVEAAKDLPAALERMESLKLTATDSVQLLRMLLPLTAGQPSTFAAAAEKLPPGWIGGSAIPGGLLTALAKAAPDRIHEIVERASAAHAAATDTTHAAALHLFDSDPQLALQLSICGNTSLVEIFGNIVPDLARSQPRAALDLLRNAPPSSLRQSILMESLTRLRAESPEAARHWMDSLEDGSLKDAARVLVEQPELSRTAAQFAVALATATAEDAPASSSLEIDPMLGRLMLSDPLGTVGQVMALPEGALRENSLRTASQKWAGFSTPDALAWSETLSGADRIAAQSGIVREWAEYEPAEASEFVQSMPPGSGRDGPAAALARGVSTTDPAAGLVWAASITDPARRSEVLQEVAQGWLKESPEAARRAVSLLPGISETERAALLTPPAR